MLEALSATRHLADALEPLFLDEDVRLTLVLDLQDRAPRISGVIFSAHQRLLLEAACQGFLEALRAMPCMCMLRPRFKINLLGRMSDLHIEIGDNPEAHFNGWTAPFANFDHHLTEFVKRIDAVERGLAAEGPVQAYTLIETSPRQKLYTLNARSPEQALHLFVACKAPTAKLRDTAAKISQVLLECPESSWKIA